MVRLFNIASASLFDHSGKGFLGNLILRLAVPNNAATITIKPAREINYHLIMHLYAQ